MRSFPKKLLAALLCALLALAAVCPAFAADSPFDEAAYASIVTGSDFQDAGTKAYDRFGRLLTVMKNDGLPTPDSMLVGGDYTKLLFDYAVPGIAQIRKNLTEIYPEADAERVVCIQGNHDNVSSGFAKTGFYDMGAYNLYVINEDDFPWMQMLRPGVDRCIKKVADDLEKHMNALIDAGDKRPVIVMTHLPLHHTSRTMYGENKYASYIFNVLNEAGKTLDVVFLFGHQHSGDYDDYIGGSVNFLRAGETLRVPKADSQGETAYTEETLAFTYANCGYVGYSNNSESETSTNALTLGVIQLSETNIRFVKYTEEGVYKTWDVARKTADGAKETDAAPTLENPAMWQFEQSAFLRLFELFLRILALFSVR